MGGGGKDTLASVRTRAEGRGTTVYASAKYPLWETSKVFLLENVEGVFLGSYTGLSSSVLLEWQHMA